MKAVVAFLGAVALPLAQAGGCSADPCESDQGPNVATYDNGKHYISAIGKWKYGTTVGPVKRWPACKWELWGLQKDGWQRLYSGNSGNKAKLPPEGLYTSVYLESRGCGKWEKK